MLVIAIRLLIYNYCNNEQIFNQSYTVQVLYRMVDQSGHVPGARWLVDTVRRRAAAAPALTDVILTGRGRPEAAALLSNNLIIC